MGKIKMNNKISNKSMDVKVLFLLQGNDLSCLSVDNNIELITGYAAQELLTNVVSFKDLTHPDDCNIYDAIFSHDVLLAAINTTFRVVKKEGSINIITITCRKECNKNNQETYINLFLKNNEVAELDVFNESISINMVAMLENTNDYIYFKDKNHVFTGASQTLVNLTHSTKHWTDLIGKTDYDVFTREFADIYYTLEKQVFYGEVAVAQEVQPFLDEHGNQGWVDNRKYPIKDAKGNIVGLFGIARDITNIKLAKEAAVLSQSKFSSMFHQAPIGIALIDSITGEIYEVNKKFADITGRRVEEVDNIDWMAMTHPDDIQEDLDNMQRMNSGETSGFNMEKRYRHIDGSYVWIHMTIAAFKQENNLPYHLCMIEDISKRKYDELMDRSRNHILKMIAQDELVADVLQAIVQDIEKNNSDMLCSILLLDKEEQHLLLGAAPSLPDFYNEAIHGVQIGMGIGSCGTAAFTKKAVIVDDIQTHAYWQDFKELAEQAKLRACWSQPVLSSQGKVLATFAIYHHDIHSPDKDDMFLINQAVDLVGICIEKAQASLDLKASEERWRFALEGTGDGIWDFNFETKINLVSKQLMNILGVDILEDNASLFYSLLDWEERLHPQSIAPTLVALNAVAEGKTRVYEVEQQIRCEDGSYKWLLSRGMVVSTTNTGKPLRMLGVSTDITRRKENELKLQLAANVFTYAREGIMITDASGHIIDVNKTFSDITGYSRQEIIGKNPSILQSTKQNINFYRLMWESLLKKGHWVGEIWNLNKQGQLYAENLTISTVYDEEGNVQNYVGLFSDITVMKEHQEQLEHIAHYDVLTRLPNRVLLADRLEQAMRHCDRYDLSLAVVFLDLDGFKAINDTYGHDIGDKLLIELSVRMKLSLREDDTLARFGGDEFVAILVELETVDDCKPVLERLLTAASNSFMINEIEMNVSASVGLTLYPDDNVDTEQLMRHADQAMYIAKRSGKNRYHIFDVEHDNAIKIKCENLDDIRIGLANNEFVLYYQPKVNMKHSQIVGFEALIRWQHPARGLIAPLDFLPLIDNDALIIEIGEWVIEAALKQILIWQEQGVEFSISVNIDGYQLQGEHFNERLRAILDCYPMVSPKLLQLEILETSALEDIIKVSRVMEACAALGIYFALDDFGTGYSSLTYFRRLPAKLIKIDQSFVRDMLIDPEDFAIVESVIGLAKAFKREVIAEGVESKEHGEALMQLGCDLAQGYGIAKPIADKDVLAWVNEYQGGRFWQI